MGGKHSTTTSKVTIPPEVLARYNAVNARAETAANTPYQAFGKTASDYVAQMNAQQNAGISDINATAGSYQPYMTQATAATQAGMGPAYEGIDNYMSPYIKNVADTTGALMKQQYEQAQSGALGTAASSGAFGGDRAGIAAANMQQQNQLGYGSTMANIMNQGYTQALGASQADLARQLQGGSQMAALGAQSQQLGLQGAQAKIAAGTMQQQTEQAGKDAMIKQFMQEKGYPFQTAQFLANIAMGTGANSGSSTSTSQPMGFFGNLFADGGKVNGYADGGGVAGPMTSAMSAFGDEGYVPAASLPVGRLMIADPPAEHKRGGADDIMKIVKLVAGMAHGGVAGGRHGYALDGSVLDPKGESQGDYIGRVTDPYYHFLTQTAPHAALGLGARIASLAPKAASVVAGFAKRPETSTMLDQAASDLYDYGLRTSAKGLEYRDPTLPAPLTGQAALDLGKTTPQQDAAREAFMRQNMDLEPSRVGPDGYTPSDYAAAMLRGPTAAGWTLGSQPRVSVMTPHGVAGRPEVDVGSMPAAPQRVYGRPDVPMIGSMPAAPAPAAPAAALPTFKLAFGGELTLNPDGSSSVTYPNGTVAQNNKDQTDTLLQSYGATAEKLRASQTPAPLGMFDMPVGSMPIRRPPRRPEGLGYMPTMPEGGPTTLPAGLMPASLAPLTSPIPQRRPVDLGTPVIPTEEGAGLAKAALTAVNQPPVVAGADVDTLFTQGIGKNEGGLGPNGEPLIGAAGEVGYSQMLPSTGPEAAKLAGLPWNPERFRTDTEYNKALGKAYYGNLLKMFGDPVKAAAAYNAGMGRLGSAIDAARNYGGTWMDHMPATTQDYVKKFAANVGMTAPPTLDGLAAARVAPAVDTAADTTGGLLKADMAQRDPLHINKPYDERNMIGQFFHDPETGKINKNAVMSVLAGLGSMANSNSVFPLTAMLQGVAGGSEAYKQLQKQAADIAQTEAATRQTDIMANASRFFKPEGGVAMVTLPDKRTVKYWDLMRDPALQAAMNPQDLASIKAQAEAAGETTPRAASGNSIFTDATGKAILDNEASYVEGPSYDTAIQRSMDIRTQVNSDATTARGMHDSTVEQLRAVSDMLNAPGIAAPGAAGSARAQIVKYGNTILASIGLPQIEVGNLDTDADILGKIRTSAGLAAANGADQNSVQALQMIADGMPNENITREANAVIMSTILTQQQKAMDKDRLYSDYAKENPYGTVFGAADMFARMNQKFDLERDALQKLMTVGGTKGADGVTIMERLTSGELSPQEAQSLIALALGGEAPTADIYRYFIPYQVRG